MEGLKVNELKGPCKDINFGTLPRRETLSDHSSTVTLHPSMANDFISYWKQLLVRLCVLSYI
ncbi:MAG: hypothetical protein DRH90_20115 [Deltaproteobacteria bacterium]|nr:MAG: hypothetical protein DRH90_20115 [Deltaproteobacteria bacterium]